MEFTARDSRACYIVAHAAGTGTYTLRVTERQRCRAAALPEMSGDAEIRADAFFAPRAQPQRGTASRRPALLLIAFDANRTTYVLHFPSAVYRLADG